MNMSEWIKTTPRLAIGLGIIDCLDNGKFRALVNHLCSTLKLYNSGKAFSYDEEERLLASLEIKKETLIILLDTIELIYLQAAYEIIKPPVMETLMKQSFPISEEKISIFTSAWMAHAKGIIECLQHQSIFPVQVVDVNWQLNVRSSSSTLSQEINPVVWLQLGFSGLKKNSTLTVEMDKNDLGNIYNIFEDIQRQLDLLEWAGEKS